MCTDSIDWKMDFDSLGCCFVHDLLEGAWVSRHVDFGDSELVSIELSEEGVAHAATNNDLIGNVKHVEDELDLVSHL